MKVKFIQGNKCAETVMASGSVIKDLMPQPSSPNTSLSIGGIDVGSITTGVTISVSANKSAVALLEVLPSAVEIETEADIFIKVGDKRYRLMEVE